MPLVLQDAEIGAVLRTHTGLSPLYISPGHRMDIVTAVRLVLRQTSFVVSAARRATSVVTPLAGLTTNLPADFPNLCGNFAAFGLTQRQFRVKCWGWIFLSDVSHTKAVRHPGEFARERANPTHWFRSGECI